jgi:protein-disulfide isomerase
VRTHVSRRRTVAAIAALSAAGSGCAGGRRSTGTTDGTPTPSADPLPPLVAGDPDAAVTVAAYEDFACPHCADYNATVVPELRRDYIDDDRIRYEHRDFPIPVSDASRPAANAARAVQDRVGDGAFWRFAEGLFERQRDLGPERYASLASTVGADGAAVRRAAVARQYRVTVERDRERGAQAGVRGTPAVLVDGEIVPLDDGSETPFYGRLSARIDAALGDGTPTTDDDTSTAGSGGAGYATGGEPPSGGG